MKSKTLPAIAWIALAFASVLALAVVSVHHFQIPPAQFMAPAWWWLDIVGLAIATAVFIVRAARAPVPQDA